MKHNRIGKGLSLAVAVLLLLASAAGCSSAAPSAAPSTVPTPAPATTPPAEATAQPTTAAPTDAPKNVNRFGWEIPEKTIEFTAYDAEELNPSEQTTGTDNMNAYLLKEFNVKINRVVEDTDPVERLNLMITAGDYPEVIYWMTYSDMTKWADQGKLVDMAGKLDTILPDVKAKISDLLPLYYVDGKLWGIPLGTHWLDIPDYTAHLRYDWLMAMGNPKVQTPDDFYNIVMQMLKDHPTSPNGEKVYSISLYDQGNPLNFSGYWGLKNGWKIDAQNKFTYWAFTDEGKKMTQWFNRFYRSGSMDPDAFINNFDQWKAKFTAERIVSAIGGWWIAYNAGHEVWKTTDPNWTEEKRYLQVTFKDAAAEAAYLTPKDGFGYGFTVITDKAKDPEGIMKFINFEATELGSALTGWGVPNECPGVKKANVSDWSIDEAGKWSFNEDSKKVLLDETYDYAEGVFNGNWVYPFFVDLARWPDGVHCCWTNQMWLDENKWKKMMQENTKGTIYDFTAARVSLKSGDPLLLTEQAIKDAWKQAWPLAVQAKSDAEFETAWTGLQSALTAAGIDDYTKFRGESYANNLKLMGK